MRIYRMIEAWCLRFINFVWCLFVKIHEKKNIKSKKSLYEKQQLTKEQKAQIDQLYLENYGKRVPYHWSRLYQSYTGKFDHRYLPEYLFTTDMELLSNQRLGVLPLENKALLSNFVRGMEGEVRIPVTYVSCVQGRYYDGNGDRISSEEAINILGDLNHGVYSAICKKTTDTSSGRDVRLIRVENGVDQIQNESVKDILSSMGSDFIVQEKIIAHPRISALYEGSINTLRVITYQTSGGYRVAPITIRIGRNGHLDNAHAGGMFVGVTKEGVLLKEAFTEYQERYLAHPVSGVSFEGYTLPRIPDVIRVAIKMHKNYPTLGFISWDFAVDENENIVLIEANLHSHSVWFAQIAHGEGLFGEDTAEMLRQIAKKKN